MLQSFHVHAAASYFILLQPESVSRLHVVLGFAAGPGQESYALGAHSFFTEAWLTRVSEQGHCTDVTSILDMVRNDVKRSVETAAVDHHADIGQLPWTSSAKGLEPLFVIDSVSGWAIGDSFPTIRVSDVITPVLRRLQTQVGNQSRGPRRRRQFLVVSIAVFALNPVVCLCLAFEVSWSPVWMALRATLSLPWHLKSQGGSIQPSI